MNISIIEVTEDGHDQKSNLSEVTLEGNRVATYTKYVKVIEHTSTLRYSRVGAVGGRITGFNSDPHHRVTRNFTASAWSYGGEYKNYTSKRAWGGADIAVSLVFKGTWTFIDGECYIRVDNRGNVHGYLRE